LINFKALKKDDPTWDWFILCTLKTFILAVCLLCEYDLLPSKGREVRAMRHFSNIFKNWDWKKEINPMKLLQITHLNSIKHLFWLFVYFTSFCLFLLAMKEVRAVRVCSNVLENRDWKKEFKKGKNKSTQP